MAKTQTAEFELLRYVPKGNKRRTYRVAEGLVLDSNDNPLMRIAELTHIAFGKASQIFKASRKARLHRNEHCFTLRDSQQNELNLEAANGEQRKKMVTLILDNLELYSDLKHADIERIRAQIDRLLPDEIAEIELSKAGQSEQKRHADGEHKKLERIAPMKSKLCDLESMVERLSQSVFEDKDKVDVPLRW